MTFTENKTTCHFVLSIFQSHYTNTPMSEWLTVRAEDVSKNTFIFGPVGGSLRTPLAPCTDSCIKENRERPGGSKMTCEV